jgi:short-subunit dehydrogenase
MFDYSGKTALITGASSGIGESFARELAARGMNVVLVARSEAKLRLLVQELSQRHNVRAEAIMVDLSQEKATLIVQEAMQQFDLEVDLLINNAALLVYAPFEQTESLKEHQMIMLNVAAMVELTHAFIPAMLARGTGAVLNVASTGAFFAMPYQTVYAATKAFILSFSEGLWVEYRDRGVRVLALCPGPTRTPMLASTTLIEPEKAAPPEQVAAAGLRALEQGQSSVVPGIANKLSAHILPKVLGRSRMPRFVARTTRLGVQDKLFSLGK